jgi:hypothetical protein
MIQDGFVEQCSNLTCFNRTFSTKQIIANNDCPSYKSCIHMIRNSAFSVASHFNSKRGFISSNSHKWVFPSFGGVSEFEWKREFFAPPRDRHVRPHKSKAMERYTLYVVERDRTFDPGIRSVLSKELSLKYRMPYVLVSSVVSIGLSAGSETRRLRESFSRTHQSKEGLGEVNTSTWLCSGWVWHGRLSLKYAWFAAVSLYTTPFV